MYVHIVYFLSIYTLKSTNQLTDTMHTQIKIPDKLHKLTENNCNNQFQFTTLHIRYMDHSRPTILCKLYI